MRQAWALSGVAAFSCLMGASQAHAQSNLGFTGETPLVCRAGLDPAGGGSAQLSEFCNDPGGFDLFIDYPASLAGSTLAIDGRPIVLTNAGTVLIAHAGGPGNARQTLRLDAPSTSAGTATVSLTVRLVPTDATQFAEQ